jgi:plastocyanin
MAMTMLLSMLGVVLAAPAASAATFSVEQRNLQFVPGAVNVAVGDTVTWTNSESDGTVHSVVQPGGAINSPDMPPGSTYTFTFTGEGTYNVTCRFHPDMTMAVTVGGSTPTTTAPPPTSTTVPTTTTDPTTPTTTSTTTAPTGTQPTGTGTVTPGTGGGAPVGVGPLPVSFHLTDNNGSWFDTNLNLFGTNSLAVAELPRVNLGALLNSVPLPKLDLSNLPLLGKGGLGIDVNKLINGDLTQLTKLLPTNGSTLLGNLGMDPSSVLNLDSLRSAVGSALPAGDPRLAQANTLLDQFAAQLADLPADAPIALSSLPVGVDLEGLLADLRQWLSNDISLPVTVNFTIAQPQAASAHTVTSLIWPDGAKGFPWDQSGAWVGTNTVQLTEPGLYAFACKVHPYMLGAIVVDDPLTVGLDFGKKLHVNSRNLNVPSNSDIIMQLVQKFFNITAPSNWQQFSDTEDKVWNPTYPPAPILVYNEQGQPELIPVLDLYFKQKFQTPKILPALGKKPAIPGIGEVWIDTQKEQTASKTKVGTATKVNVETWTVDRKVALPEVNMNNPHNMWTDKDEKYIYQTEWFSNKLDVFERATGKFVRQIEVGPDPSHVMTRTDTDQLHVALNGGAAVMELSPGATKIDRRLATQPAGSKVAHPHAHWMSGDGQTMVTPNVNTYNATVFDVPSGTFRIEGTGELPIATGMTPDASKAYQADFLGGTVSCISMKENACLDGGSKVHYKRIDLWKNYDPVRGATGDWGGLDIQLPVAPDNSALLVANTLTSNITVIDPKTDEIVKWLPCDAGCHGINFGAKKGGGYYAYVSSKFANTLSVVDPDPNMDGNPMDAAIVGKFVLTSNENTQTDDEIVGYDGFGGMGVLAIPLAYEGWVQRVPNNPVNSQLTCRQRNPVKFATVCS